MKINTCVLCLKSRLCMASCHLIAGEARHRRCAPVGEEARLRVLPPRCAAADCTSRSGLPAEAALAPPRRSDAAPADRAALPSAG